MANIEAFTKGQLDALAAAGYDTPEKIEQASDEELDEVDGIGPASIKAYRESGPTMTPEQQAQERSRAAAAEQSQSASGRKLDETVPGGRYMLDDRETIVDSEGQRLNT